MARLFVIAVVVVARALRVVATLQRDEPSEQPRR
jgi:hypothetical protein